MPQPGLYHKLRWLVQVGRLPQVLDWRLMRARTLHGSFGRENTVAQSGASFSENYKGVKRMESVSGQARLTGEPKIARPSEHFAML